jgi:hypothetical protein
LFAGEEKLQNTVVEQTVRWGFKDESRQLLERMYYEADRALVFGVTRNYLFQVYQSLGLLEKVEDQRVFWAAGGFYKKRNQLISGVSMG